MLAALLRSITILTVALGAFPLGGVPAQAARADLETFDAGMRDELAALAPELLPTLDAANAAYRQGESAVAEPLYRKVSEALPTFDHALRRRCATLSNLGRNDEAIPLCRAALDQRRSVPNLGALGQVLVRVPDAPTNVLREVEQLGDEIRAQDPDATDAYELLGMVALSRGDLANLDRAAARLTELDPENVHGAYFATIAAINHERWSDARVALARGRSNGLTAEAAAALERAIDEGEPTTPQILAVVGWTALVWVTVLLALLIAGFGLSRATLRAARELPVEATGRAQGGAATVRSWYRRVLWFTCLYYYLSIPLVIALVLGAGAGLIYGFVAAGYIPVKLTLFIGIGVVVTLVAVGKGFFVRQRGGDPGEPLDLAAHPRFRALLDDVARAVGTRPVDTVYLTPGTDIAVFEQGTLAQRMRGRTPERCLLLGIGVLDGMSLRELQGILAHEYGHFSNEDTAGGDFALAVRRSLFGTAENLARAGAANWYNPAWLFLNGFHRVFLRISHGASRLQEVLADRWSAFLYGSENFVSALTHTVRRSVAFDAHIAHTLAEVVEHKAALANLYRYEPGASATHDELDGAVAEALAAPPTPYDSHPRPADRFALVRALDQTGTEPLVEADAWSAFDDRDAVERHMTNVVRDAVAHNHGLRIPADPSEIEPSPADEEGGPDLAMQQ